MGLWRADGDKLTRITPTAIGLEALVESYVESDLLEAWHVCHQNTAAKMRSQFAIAQGSEAFGLDD